MNKDTKLGKIKYTIQLLIFITMLQSLLVNYGYYTGWITVQEPEDTNVAFLWGKEGKHHEQ